MAMAKTEKRAYHDAQDARLDKFNAAGNELAPRDLIFEAIKFDDEKLSQSEQTILRELIKNALINNACPRMFKFLNASTACNGHCRACWLFAANN